MTKIDKGYIEKIMSEPLTSSLIKVTDNMEKEILNNGGKDKTLDKKGTPFEGADEIFKQTAHEIEDSFSVSDASVDFYKKYEFTSKEIEFVKTANPRRPFHFKRLKEITFIKTSDNKLLLASEYQRRLECGLVKLSKTIEIHENRIEKLNKEVHMRNLTILEFTTNSLYSRIKLAIKIILKGGRNG